MGYSSAERHVVGLCVYHLLFRQNYGQGDLVGLQVE